jgi:alpha-L-rhamnosidase
VPPVTRRPAYEVRGVITLGQPVACARLYATAHGLYEAFLGGRRVGDQELAPGSTQYGQRLQVQAYDVTGLLAQGANELTVLLSDGWFHGQTGLTRAHDQWGDRTAFLAQLHVEHPDGTVTVAGTDGSWQSRPSFITAADLIEGQSEDHRLVGRAGGWEAVRTPELGYGQLVWSPAPPVRRVAEIGARSVTRLADGRHVADLGQNINGWTRLGDLGPAGTELTLVHGEALDGHGDVTTDHLRPAVPFLPAPLPAGMVDQVVSAGRDGDIFEPRHTTHGFRYVRIEGHPGELTAADVTGVVVHTDLRRTGWFSCSDERVNALHEAAVWSFRGNACDVPTDCPQRERAGWTGDWQLYVPTAAFLYDVAGFSAKWLRDVDVLVPAGSTAEVVLPDRAAVLVGSGRHCFEARLLR